MGESSLVGTNNHVSPRNFLSADNGVFAESEDTAKRILDGALRALARHGLQRVSMSDVWREARVSHSTLYRYFKSKAQLLAAVASHVEEQFNVVLLEAVAADPSLDRRLEVVLDVIVHFDDYVPEAIAVLKSEPEFAMEFLPPMHERHVAVVKDLLSPVLQQAAAVRAGSIGEEELTDAFLRLAFTAHILPTASAENLPRVVQKLWRGMASEAQPDVNMGRDQAESRHAS